MNGRMLIGRALRAAALASGLVAGLLCSSAQSEPAAEQPVPVERPSRLDYLVLASMADGSSVLAMAEPRPAPAREIVARQK